MFDRKPHDSNTPTIRSKRDIVAYLRSVLNDVQMASLIGDVMEQTGLDGRIDVKEGGHGQPYEVEWPGQSQSSERSGNAFASQIEHCQEMFNQAASESEKNLWR